MFEPVKNFKNFIINTSSVRVVPMKDQPGKYDVLAFEATSDATPGADGTGGTAGTTGKKAERLKLVRSGMPLSAAHLLADLLRVQADVKVAIDRFVEVLYSNLSNSGVDSSASSEGADSDDDGGDWDNYYGLVTVIDLPWSFSSYSIKPFLVDAVGRASETGDCDSVFFNAGAVTDFDEEGVRVLASTLDELGVSHVEVSYHHDLFDALAGVVNREGFGIEVDEGMWDWHAHVVRDGLGRAV